MKNNTICANNTTVQSTEVWSVNQPLFPWDVEAPSPTARGGVYANDIGIP